jgi:hypothetical protein
MRRCPVCGTSSEGARPSRAYVLGFLPQRGRALEGLGFLFGFFLFVFGFAFAFFAFAPDRRLRSRASARGAPLLGRPRKAKSPRVAGALGALCRVRLWLSSRQR